jgi:hypothetical protein
MERIAEPPEKGIGLPERPQKPMSWLWWSLAFVLYTALLSVHLAGLRMMWSDEFLAWKLISDPSWQHMFGSLKEGVDGGGLLFYMLGRLVAKLAGLNPNTLRFFYGAFCFSAAGLLWGRILRRYFSLVIAVFCVGVVWLCSGGLLFHLAEIRFYGQLLLGLSCTVTGLLWIEEASPSLAACFLISFAANSLLVTSHMLGVMYSGLLLSALLFSRLSLLRRLMTALGTLAAWCWLVLILDIIRADSTALSWIMMPHVSDLARNFVHTPLFLGSAPQLSVVVDACLLVFAVAAAMVYLLRKQPETRVSYGRHLLIILSIPLMLVPVVVYVLSHVYKPLFTERYLMPGLMGRMALVACGLWMLSLRTAKKPSTWKTTAWMTAVSLVLIALHVQAVREMVHAYDPFSDLVPLLHMSGDLPVILQDQPLIDQVRYYGGVQGARFFFLVDDRDVKSHWVSIAAMRRGYEPAMTLNTDFITQHPKFLFIETPFSRTLHMDKMVLNDTRLTLSPAGTVSIRGVPADVYLAEVTQSVPQRVVRTR